MLGQPLQEAAARLPRPRARITSDTMRTMMKPRCIIHAASLSPPATPRATGSAAQYFVAKMATLTARTRSSRRTAAGASAIPGALRHATMRRCIRGAQNILYRGVRNWYVTSSRHLSDCHSYNNDYAISYRDRFRMDPIRAHRIVVRTGRGRSGALVGGSTRPWPPRWATGSTEVLVKLQGVAPRITSLSAPRLRTLLCDTGGTTYESDEY